MKSEKAKIVITAPKTFRTKSKAYAMSHALVDLFTFAFSLTWESLRSEHSHGIELTYSNDNFGINFMQHSRVINQSGLTKPLLFNKNMYVYE